MKKILLIIIVLLSIAIVAPVSYARESVVNQDTHFCDPGTPIPRYSLYKRAYCNAVRSSDSDIYEAVAAQFNIDKSLVEKIIQLKPLKADDIPDPLKELYGSLKNFKPGQDIDTAHLVPVRSDVYAAYEKEKVLDHMKKSLKQEFSASEKFYNAKLPPGDDFPIDLVVDLNLIDVMLFGSKAQWNNDVFSFSFDDEEGGASNKNTQTPDKNTPPDSGGNTDRNHDAGGPGATEEPPFDPGRDCVPPDAPDAEPPSPGEIPPNCGDNRLDRAEQCDDGNNRSGDGCNNLCQLEDTGSLLCRDTEVVTFLDYEPGGTQNTPASAEGGSGSPGDQTCPPGTRPRRDRAEWGITGGPPPVPESPLYPGPFTGGILPQYPPGNAPACPPGETELEVEIAGTTRSLSDIPRLHIPRCIPTEFCADFDAARNFLFGEDWEEDEERSRVATSIEALFCVNIVTANRPESPYALNEGCIDCHIRAMVDELDKLLQNTIAPLENTRNAFAISNRWGPNFSFDLNISLRPKTKLSKLSRVESALAEAAKAEEKRRKERSGSLDDPAISPPDVPRYDDVTALIEERNKFNTAREEKYFKQLKNYRFNASGEKSQQFTGRLNPLLLQWNESFKTINGIYTGLANAIQFREKNQCSF